MDQPSELLRRLRMLSPDRRESFLAQLENVTGGTRSAPLSYRQEQLWLFDRVASSSTSYGLGFAVRLTGTLDISALEEAVNDVVERHTVLRSIFPTDDPAGTQIVQARRRIRLPVAYVDGDIEAVITETALAELRDGFDLAGDHLIRFRLFCTDQEHLLMVISHHLVIDPHAANVLCRDLAAAYASQCAGEAPAWSSPAPQFGAYANWQREWAETSEAEQDAQFWGRELAGWENTELPTDLPRPRFLDLSSGVVEHALPQEVAESMRRLAGRLAADVSDVALAAYLELVSRHTATSDLVIGIARQVTGPFDDQSLVGDKGNLVPLRVEVGGPSFADLVGTVRERRVDAETHGDLPFKLVLDRVGCGPDPSRLPLVQVGFTNPVPSPGPIEAAELIMTLEQIDTGIGTLEFTLEVDVEGSQPVVKARYATALYKESTAARLASRYVRLLETACQQPDEPLTLSLANDKERWAILSDWNAALCDHRPQGIPELLEQVVEVYGDRIAMATAKNEYSYAQIDSWSNRMAHHLVAIGVSEGDFVPVVAERDAQTLVAILGVLKAGAAYVPIDMRQPAGRVAEIVRDCNATKAIVTPETGSLLPDGIEQIDIEVDLSTMPTTAPEQPINPDAIAYVIYTSGSSGHPKGVLIQHRNITNFVRTVQDMFHLGPDDRVLQFASFGFDVSVFEIFGALLSGALLYVVDDDERRSIETIDRLMVDKAITVIDLPPTIMELLEPERYHELRVAFVGGEAFSGELTTRWAKCVEFYNGYGPTETTVTVVAKRCEGRFTASPPIGRAMANHRAYVLGSDLELQPPGAIGELAIAGIGVGCGYLGQPGMTGERFRPDPYGPPGSRMYLTGDLVIWNDDGELEFLGRADRQIQVHGVRVELGEVEAAIQSIDGVDRAVAEVAVDPHRGTLLVAYLVPSAGTDLQLDAVRGALGARLPSAMIPSVLVPLPVVPLTQSGKVDRRALPPVEFASADELDDLDDSGTATEQKVRSEIFAPLLGTRVGNHTNFFASGGTSLQALRIAARVKAAFEVEVPIAEFFSAPTVVGLAALIDEALDDNQHRRNALSDALKMVEGLSDPELEALGPGVTEGN